MNNPYKEIVEKLAENCPFVIKEYCFYCHNSYNPFSRLVPAHTADCLYGQAQTLLNQNPDSEEDNPWTLCLDLEVWPEVDNWYLVTLENKGTYWVECLKYTWIGSSYKCAFQRDHGVAIDAKIIAWMPKPKPYQPSVQKPAPESKYKTTVIGKIKEESGKVTIEPTIQKVQKPLEPTSDPLLGWIPEWKEKPKNRRIPLLVLVNQLILSRRIPRLMPGFYDPDWETWTIYNLGSDPLYVHIPNATGDVLAWREQPQTPDPKLFEKPTPTQPKHQPPELVWKRLSEELPKICGHYAFFHEITNKRDLWYVGDATTTGGSCWVTTQYKNYTHWALVREVKYENT